MSLTFYYAPMSTASITQLVIAELGIPHEAVKVDLRAGGAKTPEFLKVNPNGKVPVIVHDGTSIWESAAITLYLGEAFGVEKKLYPAPGPKRGEAMKWVVWSNVSVAEAASRYARNTGEWAPVEQRNAKAGEAAKADLDGCLRILDQTLSDRDFVLGEYSIVDTHLNSLTDWLRFMRYDLSAFSKVQVWSARCASRPAYAKVMSAMK